MSGKIFAFLKYIYYFCPVNEFEINIYTKSKDLPTLQDGDFFHSLELFCIAENVSGNTPYMAVAKDAKGVVVGQILVIVFRKSSFFPPYIYTHARIYGPGIYPNGELERKMFPLLLHAITQHFNRKLCLSIEFSDLPKKMYGYRSFRKEGFIPLPQQEIHNSLHSMTPEERVNDKMLARIEKLQAKGVETHIAEKEEDIRDFHRLLKNYFRLKIRRDIPSLDFLRQLQNNKSGKVFLTTYKNKVIGGCSCIFTKGNAYLWHLASKRKTYAFLSPELITTWAAIKYAHAHHYDHIYFMNVGFPWKKNPKREFFLSFGGKPVTKYRWFRFRSKIVNCIVNWLYKE